jgi:glycyl-tRNA synthetase
MTQEDLFKSLVAHAKEYGFIFQSSEIYDGLSAVYDYGPLGVELKNNIKNYWWSAWSPQRKYSWIDSAIFMHPKIWEASGHVGAFMNINRIIKILKKDIVLTLFWKIIMTRLRRK